MQRHGDVVPGGAHEVVAEQRLRGEADGVQHAVDAAPVVGDGVANGVDVLGVGDVELEHRDVGAARQLAGGALGEAEAAAGAGEHDVGALLGGDTGDGEGQRGIRQHAGDHDVLAVEQPHGQRR